MSETKELIGNLRDDHDMLKDGMQENLTKAWHNEAMKNAAADCSSAAQAIEELVAVVKQCEHMADVMEHMTSGRSDDEWVWALQASIKSVLAKYTPS